MMSAEDTRALVGAAAWRVHLTGTEAESSAAFEAWLAADPQNASAWQQVQRPWSLLGEQAIAPGLIELRRAALARAHDAHLQRSRPRAFAAQAAIAAGILAVAIGGFFAWHAGQPDIYRTATGERRVVTLADGSQIALDSRSEVRVRYTAATRELTLAAGQARFDVAHDVARPFTVHAREQEVIATGTAFNVDLIGANLLVTLIEGRVVVQPVRGGNGSVESRPAAARGASSEPATRAGGVSQIRSASPIALDAGEQLAFSPATSPTVTRVNVDRAMAWQNGELVFENEPMSTVAARVSRYAEHPIVVSDQATAGLRISGVFHTGDVEGFVSTIVSYLPVQSRRAPDGTIHLTHR
jgi:transmembrane sensor